MQSSSHSLPALLIISGIDLLLAALCAAIGMLVLLIGSASAVDVAMVDDRDHMSDWSLMQVLPGQFQTHQLACDDRAVEPRDIDGATGYLVRLGNDRTWQCRIQLSGCGDGPEPTLFLTTPTGDHLLEDFIDCSGGTALIDVDSQGIGPVTYQAPAR